MSTPIPARLSIVTLGVADLPTMREFYKGLGWTAAIEVGDEFAAFHLGGVVLALFPADQLTEEAALTGDEGSGIAAMTLALNVDQSEDVDRVWAAAVERGAQPIAEPVDRVWGGRSGYVADPEGNRWEIAWAPFASFDEKGAVAGFGDG